MVNLFIDTNILLHFKTFDEIKWAAIVNDDFTLVIAPIILDEIDKHKNHNNPKTARRAKIIADKFGQYQDGQQNKINLVFVPKRPPVSYFETNQLDPKHQDDCLLASILQFMEENPGENIRLVTDDLGAKMRAATLQIQTTKLGSDFRLPEQIDEQAKQIEKLKAEVSRLKDRVPKIKLCFEGNLEIFKHEVFTPAKTLDTYQKTEITKLKSENPPIPLTEPEVEINEDSILNLVQQLSGGILSDERKKKYNAELEQFYKDYNLYLKQDYDYMLQRLHLISLVFEIVNEGNTPAEDIDVWIHLPDGFEVVKKYPKKPEKPKPPYRPKYNYDMEPFNNAFLSLDFCLPGARPSPPDPDRPTIRKTNSYEITFHSKSVKHTMSHQFNYILLKYNSLDAMKSFQIDYRLNAANVPEPVVGKLNVVFKRTRL